MKPGDLVRFTTNMYRDWGLGLIIREYDMVDRDGVKHPGFYYVMTRVGERLVSHSFMEELSADHLPRQE